MTIDGTWAITYQGPTGDKQADLVLSTDGTNMTGTSLAIEQLTTLQQ